MLLGAATARMEEKNGRVSDRERDQFPVGMQVLAVDDDPVCLKVLETLLRRCQYHVTTTNQAMTALKLLREHRDMFDLVISDVHMPDMDGFKLLELVGLEMDLPVIMLSVNGETKSVMKGITHGACDYLLKPVRIEELRNIWQHVVRRKFSSREHKNLDMYKEPPTADSCHGQSQIVSRASDQSGRLSKKRKDLHSEEEDDVDETDFQEGDAPSAAKKPRVVWSIELHRKFVAAVNQLGIDKAVPKRILELMNVEKLTRENVASHLQKYRLYLKRLSAVASQQASIVAAFGGRDPSFLPTGAFEGLQSYQPFGPSAALPPFNPHGLLSRTSGATFGVYELASAKIVENVANNGILSHCAGDANKFQLVGLQENQQANLAQDSTSSLELPQLQQKWIHQENNDLSTVFSGSALVNTIFDSLHRVTSTPLPPQELLECMQSKVNVQPSRRLPSVSSELVERTVGVSANLQNSDISQEGALPINDRFPANLFDSTSAIRCGASFSDTTFVPSQSDIDQTGKFLVGMLVCPSDSLTAANNSKCGAGSSGSTMLLPPDTGRHSNYLQFGIGSHSRHEMDGMKQDHLLNQELSSGCFNYNLGACMTEQANATVPSLIPHIKVNTMTPEDKLKQKNVYDLGISRLHGGFNSGSCNFDGLLNSIIKAEKDDISFTESDMGCDFFPLGACM